MSPSPDDLTAIRQQTRAKVDPEMWLPSGSVTTTSTFRSPSVIDPPKLNLGGQTRGLRLGAPSGLFRARLRARGIRDGVEPLSGGCFPSLDSHSLDTTSLLSPSHHTPHRDHGPVAESAFVQHAGMRSYVSKHPPEPPSAMEGHGPVHRLRRE
jgi:hypothetical protein